MRRSSQEIKQVKWDISEGSIGHDIEFILVDFKRFCLFPFYDFFTIMIDGSINVVK